MDIELPVSLEDLYVGNEKAATVKRRVVCRNCKGKAHLPRCSTCGECPKEKKMVHKRAGPGMVVQQEVMVASKEKCKREEKTLHATIEKGMPDNEEISFKYESEQKPGQIPGDVVLKLKTVQQCAPPAGPPASAPPTLAPPTLAPPTFSAAHSSAARVAAARVAAARVAAHVTACIATRLRVAHAIKPCPGVRACARRGRARAAQCSSVRAIRYP